MSTLRHFKENACLARDMGYPPNRRLTPRIIAEDRVSCLRESQKWRRMEREQVMNSKICRHARYDALLSAYAMRGVWP